MLFAMIIATAERKQGQATTCPAGQSVFFQSCTDCLQGYYNPGGQAQCTECDIGMYAATTKSVRCELCPRGYFESGRRATQCKLCGIGFHNGNSGNEKGPCLQSTGDTTCSLVNSGILHCQGASAWIVHLGTMRTRSTPQYAMGVQKGSIQLEATTAQDVHPESMHPLLVARSAASVKGFKASEGFSGSCTSCHCWCFVEATPSMLLHQKVPQSA